MNAEAALQVIVLAAFAGMVAGIASDKIERWLAALAAGFACLAAVSAALLANPVALALEWIDWNVLGLILGMNVISNMLTESGAVTRLAEALARRTRSYVWIIVALAMIAGWVSVVVDNVSTVLLMTPLAMSVAAALGISPAPIMVSIALASNTAGAATLVGDPPSAMTASAFNLGFGDFFWFQGRPGMFFITVIPMTIAILLLPWITRHLEGKPWDPSRCSHKINRAFDKLLAMEVLAALALVIALLTLKDALPSPLNTLAVPALLGAALLVAAASLTGKADAARRALRELDWQLLAFLAGVFMVSGAFYASGLTKLVVEAVAAASINIHAAVASLVWASVLVSAFLDNIPYFAIMLPAVKQLAAALGYNQYTLAWALLAGGTLGGNITYIGASANAAAVSQLDRNGCHVSFKEFTKAGLIYTLVAVGLAHLLIELIWVK